MFALYPNLGFMAPEAALGQSFAPVQIFFWFTRCAFIHQFIYSFIHPFNWHAHFTVTVSTCCWTDAHTQTHTQYTCETQLFRRLFKIHAFLLLGLRMSGQEMALLVSWGKGLCVISYIIVGGVSWVCRECVVSVIFLVINNNHHSLLQYECV
jgi:hypothetical protein